MNNDEIKAKLQELEGQLADVSARTVDPRVVLNELKATEEFKELGRLNQLRAEDEQRRQELRDRLARPKAAVMAGVASNILRVSSRLSHPDDLAVRALETVKREKAGRGNQALAFIQEKGLGSAMTKLTAGLNGSGALDETNRLLLAEPDIYGDVALAALEDARTHRALDKFVQDKEGFRVAILQNLEADDGPRHHFVRALVKASLDRSGVAFDEAKPRGARLVAILRAKPVPLSENRVQSGVEAAHEQILGDGVYPILVDEYADTRREVDPSKFTPEIRQAMVRYLLARGVSIDQDDPDQMQRFADGGYDEYFAMAYEQAISSAAGDGDPIVSVSTKGATVAPWDFTVDTFDSIEEQGIVKDNILAAGALDYIFELGERLGIYRLVDALTLNWAAGAIDVVDGPCAAKLYRYWKLRDQRMDASERGLVYKRVLNKGDVEALDRMVVNEGFETLWGRLCEKVAEYRTKVEDAKVEQFDTLLVSRTPLYQAIKDLQFNLTEFCTGMAHMQIREMYSQLREAMELLGDPEIVDHFAGGRRKTMWTAIERLAKSEYAEAPNINAIRIAAVEGNKVFRFIASFRQGAVPDDEFQQFVESAEAWIIAKGSDDTALAPARDDAEDSGNEDGDIDDVAAEDI